MSPLSVRARPSLEALADRLVPAVMPLTPGALPAPDSGTNPPALPGEPAQSAILAPGAVDLTDSGGLTPPVVAPQPVMPNQSPGDGNTASGGLTVNQVPPGAWQQLGGWTAEEPTFTGGVHVG
jgi:hypothetical protein